MADDPLDKLSRRVQKRSYSPPPMASPVEEAAIELEAESRGDRVVREERRPVEQQQVVRHEYGLERGTRNLIILLVFGTAGTGGIAIYGAARDPVPEAVKQAPVLQKDQQKDIDRVREDVAECRSDLRETEAEVGRLRRRVDSLERKLYEQTPKVTP